MAESTKTILEESDIDSLSFDEVKAVADQWGVSKAGGKVAVAKRIIEAQTAAPGPQDVDPLPDKSLDSVIADEVVDIQTGLAPVTPGKDRIEKYDRMTPQGDVVTVTHNIETGETSYK